MLIAHIESQIYKNFVYTPTEDQKKIIFSLAEYLVSTERDAAFILNGFAGTGKTTIIAAVVNTLKEVGVGVVMMAPTGRAAKVMAQYSGQITHTIHRKIYRRKSMTDTDSKFTLDFNKSNDTVYIVDEASMLSDQGYDTAGFGSGNVLSDLFEYVHTGQRNRLIFVGDNAQLPPVGADFSPALDENAMKGYCDPVYAVLKEVMRQAAESGILRNATAIRELIKNESTALPQIELSPDVRFVGGRELIDYLETSYSRYGKGETAVITRSNKRAGRFNEGIRRSVLGYDEELESGDMLMVVKNNYNVSETDAPFEFVANGDVIVVERIYKVKECYGLRFAYISFRMPDYNDYSMERWVILDTLHNDTPSLGSEQQNALFEAVMQDYAHIPEKRKRVKAVMENEFFCALQIKFAYAVTCHKAQGGQWADVYIDQMLFGEEPMTVEFARWLYTAVTRARSNVYFVGWDQKFFTTSIAED